MILRYAALRRHPEVFRSLTGLGLAAFTDLVADVLPGHAVRERERLQRPTRRRACGAGHPFVLDPRDQLLLAVVWLRVYPTHAVLGYLLGVSDSTVTRTLARWLPLLAAAGGRPCACLTLAGSTAASSTRCWRTPPPWR